MFGGLIYHGSTGKVSKHENCFAMSSSRLCEPRWRTITHSRSTAPRLVEAPSLVQKVIWRLSPMKNKCWNQHLVVGFIHSIFFSCCSCCQGFWSNPDIFFQALWLDRRLRGEMLWCEATSGAHFLRQTWRKMPIPALPQTPYWRSLWHLCPHFIPCS